MHWQPLAATQPLPAATGSRLDLWWWPQALAPPPRERRAETDAILRATLSRYVGQPAAALRFGREAHGRPYLLAPAAPDFNLSDTDGGRLVAVWSAGRVGVDLERLDRQLPVPRLARRWFAASEAQALAALDEETARRAFLALWTAKEAACKSTGTGIYGYLDAWQFAVGIDPPTLQALPADSGVAGDWHFLRLQPPGEQHTAVAACRGPVPLARGFIAI